jgi:hypothetical protein
MTGIGINRISISNPVFQPACPYQNGGALMQYPPGCLLSQFHLIGLHWKMVVKVKANRAATTEALTMWQSFRNQGVMNISRYRKRKDIFVSDTRTL